MFAGEMELFMAHVVIMPKQGLQMTEGTMIKWFYREGDAVKANTHLFEMETDKLTIDIDAEVDGTLLKILHGEGDVVPITQPIAVIGDPGEDISALVPGEAAAPAAAPAPAAPAAPAEKKEASAAFALSADVHVVIMPKQGLQMTEGTIIQWYHKEGEEVKAGQPLFSMETDKLTIDIDSEFDGTLLKIVAPEGSVVPITEPIALIGPAGTDVSGYTGKQTEKTAAAPAEAPASAVAEVVSAPAFKRKPGERIFITPRAKMTAASNNFDYSAVSGSGPDGLIIERDVLDAIANRPKASPVAAKLASLEGVDLSAVKGTGVNGKIMKDDVLGAIAPKAAAPAEAVSAQTAPAAASGDEDAEIIPIRGMRKAIFENMMHSLHETAQANHRMKVDMTEAKRLREALKAEGVKVSFNDILALAATKALLKYPCINASTDGVNIYEKHYVNIGIAVAVPNGLMVPNVKHTERMSLSEIAKHTAEQIAKTRDNKLTMEDYTGGTFTITNLGMFDVDEFTPIINAPESAILGVGKIADTPVVVNGAVAVRPIMTLSLTYDHRIINGAPAAEFLQYLKKLLEHPYLML